MSNIIKKEGFSYKFDASACQECQGKCCSGGSGYIFVNKNEIIAISAFLNLDVNDFAVKYLFKKGYKYSIKEQKFNDSYECVFYNATKNACNIYEVRPTQCITFPFWDYYKSRVNELKEECPGIIDE